MSMTNRVPHHVMLGTKVIATFVPEYDWNIRKGDLMRLESDDLDHVYQVTEYVSPWRPLQPRREVGEVHVRPIMANPVELS